MRYIVHRNLITEFPFCQGSDSDSHYLSTAYIFSKNYANKKILHEDAMIEGLLTTLQ